MRILAPQVFRIGIPGYVTGKFYTLEGQSVFVRNIFMSEDFFVELEKLVVSSNGIDGKKALYSVGKKFGYRFASLNKFPRFDLGRSTTIIFKFFETLYAEKITIDLNANSKELILHTKDLAVTRKNGMGYVLEIGGVAGIWAYLLGDYSVECAIKKTSDDEFDLICAPISVLKENKHDFFECKTAESNYTDENYIQFNSPPVSFPQDAYSMDKLMQGRLFGYQQGELKFGVADARFIPVEIYELYEIERIFDSKIVYTAAYSSFYSIGKKIQRPPNPEMLISQALTAFGFGLVSLIRENNSAFFNFQGYPWLQSNQPKLDFPFLKGALIGFLEGNTGHKYNLGLVKSRNFNGTFIVSFEVVRNV